MFSGFTRGEVSKPLGRGEDLNNECAAGDFESGKGQCFFKVREQLPSG